MMQEVSETKLHKKGQSAGRSFQLKSFGRCFDGWFLHFNVVADFYQKIDENYRIQTSGGAVGELVDICRGICDSLSQ